jgi:hypothetical protein
MIYDDLEDIHWAFKNCKFKLHELQMDLLYNSHLFNGSITNLKHP